MSPLGVELPDNRTRLIIEAVRLERPDLVIETLKPQADVRSGDGPVLSIGIESGSARLPRAPAAMRGRRARSRARSVGSGTGHVTDMLPAILTAERFKHADPLILPPRQDASASWWIFDRSFAGAVPNYSQDRSQVLKIRCLCRAVRAAA